MNTPDITPVTSERIVSYANRLRDQQEHKKMQEDEKKVQMEKDRQDAEFAAFQRSLDAEFSPAELLEELHIHYRIDVEKNNRFLLWAIIRYQGLDWHIVPKFNGYAVRVYKEGGTTRLYSQFCFETNMAGHLQHYLFYFFGKWNEYSVKEQEEEVAREQQRLVDQAQEKVKEQQRLAAYQEKLRLARAEDARIRALMEEQVQQTRATLWSGWPEGTPISFYVLRCVTGVNSDGMSTSIQGYTTTSSLNSQGKVYLQRTYRSEGRTLCLGDMKPGPYWEVVTASCIDDLPKDLVTSLIASLPHVAVRYCPDYDATDEEELLKDLFFEDASIEDPYEVVVGRQPVQWIRDLVESQR